MLAFAYARLELCGLRGLQSALGIREQRFCPGDTLLCRDQLRLRLPHLFLRRCLCSDCDLVARALVIESLLRDLLLRIEVFVPVQVCVLALQRRICLLKLGLRARNASFSSGDGGFRCLYRSFCFSDGALRLCRLRRRELRCGADRSLGSICLPGRCIEGSFCLIQSHLVVIWIKDDQRLSFYNMLVVIDQDPLHCVRDAGADRVQMPFQIGIVGRLMMC